MRYSQLFGKTEKQAPRDYRVASHQLLYRGGFIRESTAGRYYFLPLGQRVSDKIMKIIEEEMDSSGAQKMIVPVLHPLELWQETNRTTSTGFELMKVKDRRGAEFALGGTAEEMFVELTRRFKLSYKDLPFNLYQFSTKFRDELRARGGLLRVREFVMKDAYSFDRDEAEFKKTYRLMAKTYSRIFERLGLKTDMVEADNGYIGGEYCHEFVTETSAGESKYFTAGNYCAHEEIAKFKLEPKNIGETQKPMKPVAAKRGPTMEDGVKLHGLPLWQQLKDLMMVDEKGNFILGVVRGDLEVNEVKLKNVVKAYSLRHATEAEIIALDSYPGFISPIGLNQKVKIVADPSLKTIVNAYTGANAKHQDYLNVNYDRDFKAGIEADIALAKAGFTAENGQKLVEKKGSEVGNIFQLGYHYSDLMKGATFIDKDGRAKKYYMGCYGIGIGRTLQTIAEIHHDDKGIIWPESIAPYQVHLLNLQRSADEIYDQLTAVGIEGLYDDRADVSAGVKFADADLIGIPVRLVVSPKTKNKIEWKDRTKIKTELLSIQEVIDRLA
ncbi:MAG: Proline-tRNA ligase [Candidatus Beckwithbacteria bacterium GW2011_GWC2_47_9]|uniref:Proline--tRNA ligase n=1 Tax=Candidatus Beckwithbacteria bacterium GW2011_GWC2_47_9 TaxID=1618373 RepID=A0A0G1TZ49_9BACT|nr:MAG: Proline-tRNA ligase [Candidatus Beckwithbacteria bacterium GW2011_GWC2_47_9]